MRRARETPRSISLSMPLPMGTRKNPAELPIKKIHVPYFFPLLDETAEWWQMHQLALKQETGEGLEGDVSLSDRKMEMSTRALGVQESLQSEQTAAALLKVEKEYRGNELETIRQA